jgi:hypothetical protein
MREVQGYTGPNIGEAMARVLAFSLCVLLAACGGANKPSEPQDNAPSHTGNTPATGNGKSNSSTNAPAANEGRSKFEVPDGALPQPESETVYKMVAKAYFEALEKFDLAGLRRTLSRRVQNDAGETLAGDIKGLSEAYTSIKIEIVSWEASGEEWVCTFNQTAYPKSGEPEIEKGRKIYLVKEAGRWVVEQ